jgi:hypothetical protein
VLRVVVRHVQRRSRRDDLTDRVEHQVQVLADRVEDGLKFRAVGLASVEGRSSRWRSNRGVGPCQRAAISRPAPAIALRGTSSS